MSALFRWLAMLLLAGSPAWAADLPGPWVEFASDGGLDVRAITAPGMACPKVIADGTELVSKVRGKSDDDYPVQVCTAHTVASTRGIMVDGLPVPVLASDIRRIAQRSHAGLNKGEARPAIAAAVSSLFQ